jgi:DNA primase
MLESMKRTSPVSSVTIQMAKAVSIVGLLHAQGLEPVKASGKELIYQSPFRSEQTPSFMVNTAKNCFTDFGGTEEMRGDSIRLAQLLWQVGFREAVEMLAGLELVPPPSSFSFSGPGDSEKIEKGICVVSVRRLQHPALIQYVGQRGISTELARKYLREVTYRAQDRQFFAVGFPNDAGGYELRNGLGFKGGKTINGITTFDSGTDSVALFEGFFDFLSALEHYGRLAPAVTTIVMNTCNNLSRALPLLTGRKLIHCFLDNDHAGRKALAKLEKEGLAVRDWSAVLYPGFKDFNDFLLHGRAPG